MDSGTALKPTDLTVVVACVEGARTVEACLAALEAACAGLSAEIVLVDASHDRSADLARERVPNIEIVRYPPGTLVPSLWAAGLHRARGRAVAFTLANVIVGPTWARALLDGLQRATGVGGPLTLAPGGGPSDWAVFFLRYSAFLPHAMRDGLVSGEIAGDNAAYRRDALERHRPTVEQGFWEIDFHRALRAEGGTLAAASVAVAAVSRAAPFASVAHHRYRHGRQFGAARVGRGESRLVLLLAAPIVPLVLAWRAARRAVKEPGLRWPFLRSLPAFLVLGSCWAAGEARGAWD